MSRVEKLENLQEKNSESQKRLIKIVGKLEKRVNVKIEKSINDIKADIDSIAGSVDAINKYINKLQQGGNQNGKS